MEKRKWQQHFDGGNDYITSCRMGQRVRTAQKVIAQTTASNQSEAGDSTSDLKDGKQKNLMVWPGSNASPADMQAEDEMNEIGEKVDAKVNFRLLNGVITTRRT